MEITSIDQLELSKTYSYADYLTWRFKDRIELIKGKIFAMSPAPASRHQRISWNISFALGKFLDNSPCEVFYAPFDVRLERTKNDEQIQTVVQPDICVICDISKIDEKGCSGAPEVVVEILSPGNSKREIKTKYELYEEAGVLEYWIIDPEHDTALFFYLKNGTFQAGRPLAVSDSIKSKTLNGFELPLKMIFK
ncbi:MAG: Uma2 family endonuclease [Spirosomaceae bacterium]|nr:Uma2 family endonuclease [Spirosomataceae bacterium]